MTAPNPGFLRRLAVVVSVAFCFCLAPTGVSSAQSPQELARQAGEAMQRGDYATAEGAYRSLIPQAPGLAELHSNLGLACFMQQKIPCSVEAFRTALGLKPDLFLPNYLLGQVEFQQGRYADARVLVERAVDLQPEQAEARQLLVAILVGLKEYTRAVEEWTAILASNPGDVDARYGLGGVYMQLSQQVTDRLLLHDGSGYALLVAAERDASDPQWRTFVLATYLEAFANNVRLAGARVPYARLQLADGQWTAARTALEEELQIDPNSYEARFYLAQAALGEGNLALSIRMLDEAVSIRPEFFVPLPELVPLPETVDRHALRAALESAEESFGRAYLLAALDAPGPSPGTGQWRSLARRLRDRALGAAERRPAGGPEEGAGLELVRRKRYESGLEILLPLALAGNLQREHYVAVAGALVEVQRHEDVIALFRATEPEGPEELYLLASSYRQAALAQYERMVQMQPDSARAHQVLGDSYLVRQQLDQALEEYERAAELAPTDSELRFQVGSVLHRMMEYGRSAEVFAQVVEQDPLNAEARILRGEALARLGRDEEAIRSLESGLALRPQSPAAHVALGRVYRTAGKPDEALRHLSMGAASDRDGSVHYQLFLLYRELNRPQEARAALATSQRLRAKGR